MRHQRYEYFAFRLGLLLAEAQFANLVLAYMLLGAPRDLQDPSAFTQCLEAATMEVFTADADGSGRHFRWRDFGFGVDIVLSYARQSCFVFHEVERY